MKTLHAVILTLALCAGSAFAGSLTPEQAAQNIDKKATVVGTVTKVVTKPKGTFLKLGKEQGFTAVIFAADRKQFGNLKKLNGEKVSVSGRIEKDAYGKPEIVVNSPRQLSQVK